MGRRRRLPRPSTTRRRQRRRASASSIRPSSPASPSPRSTTAGPDSRVAALRLVVVDDLHEATESTLAILRALGRRGIASSRSATPTSRQRASAGESPTRSAGWRIELGIDVGHRPWSSARCTGTDPRCASFVARITERIGTAAAGSQRSAVPAGGDATRRLRRSSTIEATTPARRARVRSPGPCAKITCSAESPWRDLAVVVRSGCQLAPAIARALALAEVPGAHDIGRHRAARGHGRARPAQDRAGRRSASSSSMPSARRRAAPRPLRRVRRPRPPPPPARPAGRGAEGRRRRDERRAARAHPGSTGSPHPYRFADRARVPSGSPARSTRCARATARSRNCSGSCGSAAGWRRPGSDEALGAGLTADEANRDLDAVVALFAAAKDFVERRPQDVAPREIAAEFISEILTAELAGDILTAARNDDSVLVTTPSGAVGLRSSARWCSPTCKTGCGPTCACAGRCSRRSISSAR